MKTIATEVSDIEVTVDVCLILAFYVLSWALLAWWAKP